LDANIADNFRNDPGLAQEDVQAGVFPSRACAADAHWDIWVASCADMRMDPTLQIVEDPVPFLQVFAYRYRHGHFASKTDVRSKTVDCALRNVGQTFASMGAPDPRITLQGKMDFRLRRQLACYTKQDPPPDRVKPVPLAIIWHVLAVAIATGTIDNLAVANMIVLAFFFLLRPGEYTATASDTTPFRMCDVQLFIGPVRIDPATADEQTLWSANFASLTFTTQKNGVRGEVIGLGRSGDPQFCPVFCIVRRILHLRHFNAPADTPLATYFTNHRWRPVSAKDISTTLKLAAAILGPTYGFLPKDISARSMRAAGATALLCAQVDSDTIRLIGRWRSDEMLRYLHVQAEPVMRHFAQRMLTQGAFIMHPGQDVPMY
jgi:hypothetical protein